MRQQERDRTFEHARGADVFAVQGSRMACSNDQYRRYADNEDAEHGVFDISKDLGQVELAHGYRSQQILYQPERTQKPAHGTSQDSAYGKQESPYIEAHLKICFAGDGKKRTDGAGDGRGGTRVAVESRCAELLELAVVQFARNEIARVAVGKPECGYLYQFALQLLPEYRISHTFTRDLCIPCRRPLPYVR